MACGDCGLARVELYRQTDGGSMKEISVAPAVGDAHE